MYGIWVRSLEPFHRISYWRRILSRAASPSKDFVFLEPGTVGTAGVISVEPRRHQPAWFEPRWIKVGFNDEFSPVIMVAYDFLSTNLRTSRKDFETAIVRRPDSSAHAKVFEAEFLRWTYDEAARQPLPSYKDRWNRRYYVFVPNILPKENGSRVYHPFDDLNIGIELSLLPMCRAGGNASVSDYGPRFIWTLDIFERKGRSPERSFWLSKGGEVAGGCAPCIAFAALTEGTIALDRLLEVIRWVQRKFG